MYSELYEYMHSFGYGKNYTLNEVTNLAIDKIKLVLAYILITWSLNLYNNNYYYIQLFEYEII